MEDGRIVIPAVHPDKIRMDEAELVGLFNIVAPTLRAAKRRIYKLGILQPFTAEQRIPLKEEYQVVYNLEMIFALAFQINTYPAQQLREYIISRLFQSEKSMVICMVNVSSRSAPLRGPSPLRTVRESFPSYGSSKLCFASDVQSRIVRKLFSSILIYMATKTFVMYQNTGLFTIVSERCTPWRFLCYRLATKRTLPILLFPHVY